MRTFIKLCSLMLLFGVFSSKTFAEGEMKSPQTDDPPITCKSKDCEAIINGFSSEPLILDQEEMDFFLLKSIKQRRLNDFVQMPDSAGDLNIVEYINLVLPNILQGDSLKFELIEIL